MIGPRNDRFLKACRGESVDAVPVWFMRQAGRSDPAYRRLREAHSILELCRTPELATEVTLQPVRKLGVDAAILFSDIVVPLAAMGITLDIQEGVGPVIFDPVRSRGDVERLPVLEPDRDVPFVIETVRALREQLDVPLIGFAGGPFTLSCYLIEGEASRDQARTKAFMYSHPEAFAVMMDRLADSVIAFLRAQISAGVATIQLFDSWIGTLAQQDFRTHVLPHVQKVMAALQGLGTPRIYFGVNTGPLLPLIARSGADVVGVDWRVPLDDARAVLGNGFVLQGNLDPSLCLAPWSTVEPRAVDVLERGGGRGHIFNLGHGVHPDTHPDTLKRLVDFVHGWSGE